MRLTRDVPMRVCVCVVQFLNDAERCFLPLLGDNVFSDPCSVVVARSKLKKIGLLLEKEGVIR